MQTANHEIRSFAPMAGRAQAGFSGDANLGADLGANLFAKGGLAPWQVRRVVAHVESSLDDAVGVQDLASLSRLSVSQFSRAFKQSFGQAPHHYVMGRRVARAQAMMLQDRDPLSQIAVAVGLADQAHLSKLFRRFIGETPNAWRRANWEQPATAIAA